MKQVYLFLVIGAALFFLPISGNARVLRFLVPQMSTNTFDIKNTSAGNSFLNGGNWRIVDPVSQVVTATTATPMNGDTLQIYGASLSLSANFDMTTLENVLLDFGAPQSNVSYSVLIRKDNLWTMHSSVILKVTGGDFVAEQDNTGLVNTGIQIGGVNKLLASSLGTIIVHAPAYASSNTPETVSANQEGFVVNTLPVVLVSFTAMKQSSGVQLAWTTQQEFNLRNFNVERSLDGINYMPIGSVTASGTSTTPRSYSFVDASLPSSVLYYRIRMMNFDNVSGFTPVRAVRNSTANAATRLSIFPNPSTGFTNVIVNNPRSQNFTVSVFNRFGQVVSRRQNQTGSNNFRLDLSGLPAGDYTLEASFEDGTRQTNQLILASQ